MTRRSGSTRALLGATAMLVAGCGTGTAVDDETPDASEATPPALAAAVVAHVDAPLVAAAALLPDGFDETLTEDTLAVELAFDRARGDHTHVRVVVSPTDPFADDEYDYPDCSVFDCEDVGTDAVDAVLVYENGAPEEDPGNVAIVADWGDRFVVALAYGPFVSAAHDSDEVMALAEALTAVANDAAVGFSTSGAYVDGGEEICEGDAWLDWYGQGNGSPKPQNYVEYC